MTESVSESVSESITESITELVNYFKHLKSKSEWNKEKACPVTLFNLIPSSLNQSLSAVTIHFVLQCICSTLGWRHMFSEKKSNINLRHQSPKQQPTTHLNLNKEQICAVGA